MSLAVVLSRGLAGLDAPLVTVEVHLGGGLPAFNLVGLPETEVKESRDRVRAALQNAQFDFPARKITVNLAPADLPKESGRFDLPIALGILAATGQLPGERASRSYEFAGELALTGVLRADSRRAGDGAVARGATVVHSCCRQRAPPKPRWCAMPSCIRRRRCSPCARISPARTRFARAVAIAPRSCSGEAPAISPMSAARRRPSVRSTIAAAGAHSLLMIGPPGTGKSMLAQRLPGILPPMSEDEALASAAIASLAGRFVPGGVGHPAVSRAASHRERASRWSAAAAIRVPARSRSRITACCSSTSCPNGIGACSKCCASRSNRA